MGQERYSMFENIRFNQYIFWTSKRERWPVAGAECYYGFSRQVFLHCGVSKNMCLRKFGKNSLVRVQRLQLRTELSLFSNMISWLLRLFFILLRIRNKTKQAVETRELWTILIQVLSLTVTLVKNYHQEGTIANCTICNVKPAPLHRDNTF